MVSVYSRSLFWKLYIPVCALLLLCGVLAALALPGIIRSKVEEEAVSAGRQLKTFRAYYTESVVAKILGGLALMIMAIAAIIRLSANAASRSRPTSLR